MDYVYVVEGMDLEGFSYTNREVRVFEDEHEAYLYFKMLDATRDWAFMDKVEVSKGGRKWRTDTKST